MIAKSLYLQFSLITIEDAEPEIRPRADSRIVILCVRLAISVCISCSGTSGNCNVIFVIIFSEEANISSLGESWTAANKAE